MKKRTSINDLKGSVTVKTHGDINEPILHACARELEENTGLRDEIETWDSEFGGDGLKDD